MHNPQKYKVGLIIGRFQPFHLGHKYLIEKALDLCEKIVIGIGSPNVTDEKNPFPLETRKKFLEEFIEKSKITAQIKNIVEIPDVPDDNEWYELASDLTGPIDVAIGDNEWVNGIYEAHNIPVVRIGFHKRETLEGTKIRNNIKNKEPWEERVPDYLLPHIKRSGR